MNKDIVPLEEETKVISNKKSLILVVSILVVLLSLAVILILIVRNLHFHRYSVSTFSSSNVNVVKKDEPGQSEIKLTDDQLNAGLKNSDIALSNPKANIKTDGIHFTGKTSKNPLSLTVKALVLPKVDGGEVIIDVLSFESAGIAAPKMIIDKATPQINNYLKNFLNLPEGFKLESVQLFDGYLLIYGRLI